MRRWFSLCEYVCLKMELLECEQRHQKLMARVNKWKLSEETRGALRQLEEQRQRHNEFLRAKMKQIEAKGEKFDGIAKQIYNYKVLMGWTVGDVSRALNYSESHINRLYKKAVG
jgi:AraC-like DNA-binding protein